MPPFTNPLEPVALPGQAIRLEPDGKIFRVADLEQMGRIGPIDYGSVSSGQTAQKDGSEVIGLGGELDMNDGNLGQFLVNPLSLVEVEIRQTGNQDQRFVNKNQIGTITPYDPANQRLIWTFESEGINAVINNPQTYDMNKSLIYYTGFKYRLGGEVTESQLAGDPASVPIDTLKRTGGGR